MPLHRVFLALEELDSRTLPSATIPVASPIDHPATIAVVNHGQGHHLHGVGAGQYVGNSLVVDAGVTDTLTGTVQLAGLGTFNLSGSVHGVGFITHGHATGELVLSNAAGTITLSLQGPIQPGFSSLPNHFNYRVTQGTGEYANLTGHGTMSFTTIPAPTSFGQSPQGEFIVRFS